MVNIKFVVIDDEVVESVLDEDFVEEYVDVYKGWNVFEVIECIDVFDLDEEDNCYMNPEIKARFKKENNTRYTLAKLIKEVCIDRNIKWDGFMDFFDTCHREIEEELQKNK